MDKLAIFSAGGGGGLESGIAGSLFDALIEPPPMNNNGDKG